MSEVLDGYDFHPDLVVLPNRRRYQHRPLVIVVDTVLMDEQGICYTDLVEYTRTAEPSVWVTFDTSWLLDTLDQAFATDPPVPFKKRDGTIELIPPWQFRLIRTSPEGKAERTRLERFGYDTLRNGKRKSAMHMVWCPSDMSASGDSAYIDTHTHADLMTWALDYRAFHETHNLPLSTTLTGVAAKFLRDERFYPNPRRKVPAATNEKARPYLPGVHQDIRAPLNKRMNATALDQRRAYHHIVQEIELPDGDTLYARGYFGDPLTATSYWTKPGDPVYDRIRTQPGLYFIGGFSMRQGKDTPYRPPCLNFQGHGRLAVWSNELPLLESLGLVVDGMYAAITSNTVDVGIAKYGEWALAEINTANAQRAKWLKPTLHAAYGLLGAHLRPLKMGYKYAKGGIETEYLLGPRVFKVKHIETPKSIQPTTTNVIMLGMIQAEVRKRTIELANELTGYGVTVTHIHADGLHAVGPLPLHIPTDRWSASPLDNLSYVDRVSWRSDQGNCMPGRPRHLDRAQVELERANLLIRLAKRRESV